MMFRRSALAAILATAPGVALAQSTEDAPTGLQIELNTIQDVEGACRLTFVAENRTDSAIDTASFQTVVFDASGRVITFTLYNFRELPLDLPRVRQFDVRGEACGNISRVLINGLSSCVTGGSESEVCLKALNLSSRTDVELLG
ncbi:hypothetical protein [Ruegeria meonggei]|uniref:Tat pathway signal sequence domain protein n=1 Tax=Ruegeria meonggei TaxID=1446476 RepID=A0A1X6ZA82_9RHOB|nr:hypothetical protein [Ruegeria meonggei]SLN45015.1 hypothetical protein RUM8411_02086 [Ruegeria meonggei]